MITQMKQIFKNAILLPEYGFDRRPVSVVVDGAFITEITEAPIDTAGADVIDCQNNLLIPAFYNAHCHAAMSIFRGYGEDLPLQRWLDERILPAEDRLSYESARIASGLSIAEMIKNGIVSFSDMYMFEDATAEEVLAAGCKANLSRAVVSFDPDIDMKNDGRLAEALALAEKYHNAGDGRVKIDLSLHAEYTNVPKACAYVATVAKERALRMHVHLSETEKEHKDCIRRHGKTPAAFFYELGVFDVPTTAAHCVYVTDEDISILAEKGVSAIHNPVSNLKLGSGVMPLRKLLDSGVNVALGSDGVASNNRMDILREMQVAAILHKGIERDPAIIKSADMLSLACRNGAISQGREDCGKILPGYRADMILIDLSSLHNIPCYEYANLLCYSAEAADVKMTVADGRILYRNGAYTLIDEERLRYEAKKMLSHYFA